MQKNYVHTQLDGGGRRTLVHLPKRFSCDGSLDRVVAGVGPSALEEWIRTCMIIPMMTKTTHNETPPCHVNSQEDHMKNLTMPSDNRQDQTITTWWEKKWLKEKSWDEINETFFHIKHSQLNIQSTILAIGSGRNEYVAKKVFDNSLMHKYFTGNRSLDVLLSLKKLYLVVI